MKVLRNVPSTRPSRQRQPSPGPSGAPAALSCMLLLALLLTSPDIAAQILHGAGEPYDPPTTPARPIGTGLTVVALYGDPAYAGTMLGLGEQRNPSAVLGSGAQLDLLVLAVAGIVSLAPSGESAVRLTTGSLAEVLPSGSLAQAKAAVDELGWLYLAHPAAGLVRLAVTKPAVVLYDSPALAAAAGLALTPTVVDIEPFADRLLLAAGGDGLLAASRSGQGVERIYDVFVDAEVAGMAGMEAAVEAVSRTPAGEPLLALRAGGKSYAAVLVGKQLQPIGRGPVAEVPLVPGGVAHLGDGGYLLVGEDGLYWFNLAGTSGRLLGAGEPLSALRAVGAGRTGQVLLGPAFDGCRGQAFLQTGEGLLAVTTSNRGTDGGDVLVTQASQQTVLRLVQGRDPVPIWPERELVGPTDAAVDESGAIWVVDGGAQTLFRLIPGEAVPMAVRGPAGSPTALVLDRQGKPILADLSLHTDQGPQPGIVRMEPSGANEEVLYAGDPLQGPVDLALDGNGNIVVVDDLANRIWLLRPSPGAEPVELAEVESPRAVALGDAGTIFVTAVPERSQPGLYRIAADGTVDALHIGDPLIQPTGLLRRLDGLLLVADGRADPFPGAEPGTADTGGLFLVDPAQESVRPFLDSWLIRRNPLGISLTAVSGRLPPQCYRRPSVRPPVEDPLPEAGAGDEGEEGQDAGCSCAHGGRAARGPSGHGAGAVLLALLITVRRARPSPRPGAKPPDVLAGAQGVD